MNPISADPETDFVIKRILAVEAPKLSASDRARLAESLLESLDELAEGEHERLWSDEAARRNVEMDADPSLGRPAAEVLRDARARLG